MQQKIARVLFTHAELQQRESASMEKAIKIFQRPTVEDPYGIGNKNYNDQREFSFSKLICFIHVFIYSSYFLVLSKRLFA